MELSNDDRQHPIETVSCLGKELKRRNEILVFITNMKGRSRPSPRYSEDYGNYHSSNTSNGRNGRGEDEDYYYEQRQQQMGRTRHNAIHDSSRYEHDPPSLNDREKEKRGKLIKFCKNNDELFVGMTVSLSNKMFPTYESLLEHLNTKISTPSGVRHVFSWPEYDEITKIPELESGKIYIVSSGRRIAKHIDYGAAAAGGKKGASTEASRQYGQKSRRPFNNKSTSPSKKQPLILTVTSNLARDSVEKMILNPKTNQNFEDMLLDLGTLLKIPKEPVTALYAADKPYRKIESYSQLFRELNEHDTFLVCGDEEIPIELMPSSSKRANNTTEKRSNTRSQHRSKMPRKQIENEPPTHRFQNHQEDEPMSRGRRQKDTGLLKSRRSTANINQQNDQEIEQQQHQEIVQENGFSTEKLEEDLPNYGSMNNSEDEDYQL